MLYGKFDKGHECPGCGTITTGSHTEGGIRHAVCPDCYIRKLEDVRDQLDEEIRMLREGK